MKEHDRGTQHEHKNATNENEETALMTQDQVEAAIAKRVADVARDVIIPEMLGEKPETVAELEVAAVRGA